MAIDYFDRLAAARAAPYEKGTETMGRTQYLIRGINRRARGPL